MKDELGIRINGYTAATDKSQSETQFLTSGSCIMHQLTHYTKIGLCSIFTCCIASEDHFVLFYWFRAKIYSEFYVNVQNIKTISKVCLLEM